MKTQMMTVYRCEVIGVSSLSMARGVDVDIGVAEETSDGVNFGRGMEIGSGVETGGGVETGSGA